MKRRMIEIKGTAEALEPIVHGGEKTGGTTTSFRREKVKVGDVYEYMPIVSANSITGQLRDQCVAWSLDQIGFKAFTDLRAFDLLFGGGTLTKARQEFRSKTGAGMLFEAMQPKAYIDLNEERALRDLFPVIGLFGGTIGNRPLGGKIDVENWCPVCAELKAYLREELWPLAEQIHIEDLLQELNFTRRDDKKNRDAQDYIDPETLAAYQHEQAVRDEDGAMGEAGMSLQMRYGFEALARGTIFQVSFTLRNPSDVEMGVFFGGLTYFEARPKIGGRTARGCGRVKLNLGQYRFAGPARAEEPMALETIETASAHLAARREQIIAVLEALT